MLNEHPALPLGRLEHWPVGRLQEACLRERAEREQDSGGDDLD